MNEIKKGRNWENVLVVVVLLIIIAIITPYFVSVIYKAQIRGACISSEGLVSAINNTYIEGNLSNIMSLPFEIKYEDKKYTAYSDGQLVPIQVKTEGKVPNSGSVILNTDGEVIVKDLKYGYISCNKEALDSEITCK